MINVGKDLPDAEMVVRAVRLQDGVYEPIAIWYNRGEVGGLYGALKQDLTTPPLDLAPPSEDGFCTGKVGLLEMQSFGWVGGDFECDWHNGEY